MDLTSRKNIKLLLKKHQISLTKRFGQNFLINKQTIKKIIESANLQTTDIVLEVGPGIGNLTKKLEKKVKRLIAVEKDSRMVRILKEEIKNTKTLNNTKIAKGDILKINLFKLGLQASKYKVVANLPFYAAAPIIRKFLESACPPKEMLLIVQKEVAQRISAEVPKMNLLAVSVQFYAKAKIVSYIKKTSFWPQPEVDAAILRITPFSSSDGRDDGRERVSAALFFKIVKAGFSHPRKQLANTLSGGLKLTKERVKSWLLKNNIRPSQRAETLKVEDWVKLTQNFSFK